MSGGHKKKTCSRGVKKSCFVSEGGKENTRFCPGVEKIPILSEGVTDNFPPLQFFNGIALKGKWVKSKRCDFHFDVQEYRKLFEIERLKKPIGRSSRL